jgi:hypothetical protein
MKWEENLALVHPSAQLRVSLVLTKHRDKVKSVIASCSTSLYRVTEDMSSHKAFEGLDFRKWEALVARLCSECTIILKADVSRFFYTAYTHSIPWAVVGKERGKEWVANDRKKLKAHWSNDLDTALQSCQSRETFGIPVGPDTSRVVAELLLAGVEADRAYEAAVKGRPAIRLLDDFIIGFDTEEDARSALASLRSALWKYNLQLNEDKTSVKPSHTLYREAWKFEFGIVSVAEVDPVRQQRDIHHLVDVTLHLCARDGTHTPAS